VASSNSSRGYAVKRRRRGIHLRIDTVSADLDAFDPDLTLTGWIYTHFTISEPNLPRSNDDDAVSSRRLTRNQGSRSPSRSLAIIRQSVVVSAMQC
jgi:hypothetical protein